MPDQPPSERFKTDVPQVPGASSRAVSQPGFKPVRFLGFLAALVFSLIFVRWLMLPKAAEAPSAAPTPQIEVPAPAPDASAALPHATESQPSIAGGEEMAVPWAPKDFVFQKRPKGRKRPWVFGSLPPWLRQPARQLLGVFAQ